MIYIKQSEQYKITNSDFINVIKENTRSQGKYYRWFLTILVSQDSFKKIFIYPFSWNSEKQRDEVEKKISSAYCISSPNVHIRLCCASQIQKPGTLWLPWGGPGIKYLQLPRCIKRELDQRHSNWESNGLSNMVWSISSSGLTYCALTSTTGHIYLENWYLNWNHKF